MWSCGTMIDQTHEQQQTTWNGGKWCEWLGGRCCFCVCFVSSWVTSRYFVLVSIDPSRLKVGFLRHSTMFSRFFRIFQQRREFPFSFHLFDSLYFVVSRSTVLYCFNWKEDTGYTREMFCHPFPGQRTKGTTLIMWHESNSTLGTTHGQKYTTNRSTVTAEERKSALWATNCGFETEKKKASQFHSSTSQPNTAKHFYFCRTIHTGLENEHQSQYSITVSTAYPTVCTIAPIVIIFVVVIHHNNGQHLQQSHKSFPRLLLAATASTALHLRLLSIRWQRWLSLEL